MRFLVDENVPRRLAEALIAKGHDVTRVQDLAIAAADHIVLHLAVRLSAVLITLDSDFGTLVYAHASEPPPGIVLVRLSAADLMEVLAEVVAVIETEMATSGRFLLVSRDGVRIRSLGQKKRQSHRRSLKALAYRFTLERRAPSTQ